ncbi:aspartate carbamoyltransferase catalytic subunit [Pseudolactococcus reticulitermitis]|uniref:Aspartate carbamoyltransferase n=1 Tax=Pseudolactococcus reticulitermitis TaxID=2025039 RepID=A0A224XBP8_9LACT|nr:aspartate carbamoyltransferase catalytic subunit [Lactococcus reticulitermitis]GAX47352.1 aspartate carbamoyltransferase [Lactococcus reticulitermitis]
MTITPDGIVSIKHLTSMALLSNDEVLGLIKRAQDFKYQRIKPVFNRQFFVANLFFENSTRTHKSFEVAEKKLGLDVIEFEASTSSVKKGETLYDTVLTMSAIGVDVCVIRHTDEDYYQELVDSRTIQAAIVNGGDGSGQHPSQSLLDLMTIYEEFGTFDGLKIMIAGDITHSRVAKSNMQMLKRLGAAIYFTGPESWYADEFDVYGQYVGLDDMIDSVDVLMLLRVQHERHESGETFSKEAYHAQYGLTHARYAQMKASAIIMHPAPVNRGVEIASDLVEAPKSRIIAQMTNGMFMRMAILEAILNGKA